MQALIGNGRFAKTQGGGAGQNRHMAPKSKYPQRDPDTPASFGKRLVMIRKTRGLSQERLAKLVPCSQGSISQIELENVEDLRGDLLFRLSDALDVSARWLIWGTGPIHKWEILTVEERTLLRDYRTLPAPLQEHVQRVVLSLLSASAPPTERPVLPPLPSLSPPPEAKSKR